MEENKVIKKRNIFVGALLTIITFSIYVLYWFVQTKREINKLGGKIPTSWLIIVPIANLYWLFRYCDEFAKIIKKEKNGILYFVLEIVFFPAFPIIIQSALNKYIGAPENKIDEHLSQNEQTSKEYIEMYKSQFPKESIKTQLVNNGISSEEVDTYLNKYF